MTSKLQAEPPTKITIIASPAMRLSLPFEGAAIFSVTITKCRVEQLGLPMYPRMRHLTVTDNPALAKIFIHPSNRITRLSLDNNALTELPTYCFTTGAGCSITANGNHFWFAAPGATMRARALPADRKTYLDVMRRVPSARFPFQITMVEPPPPRPAPAAVHAVAVEEPAVVFVSDVFSERALRVIASIQALPKLHAYSGLDQTVQTAFFESAADLAGRLVIEWVVLDFLRASTGYEQILFIACLHGTLDEIPRYTEINQLIQRCARDTRGWRWWRTGAKAVAAAEAEVVARAEQLKMPAFLEEQAVAQFRLHRG